MPRYESLMVYTVGPVAGGSDPAHVEEPYRGSKFDPFTQAK